MTVEQLIARALEQRAAKLQERNAHTARLAELRGQDAPDEAEISRVRGAQNALDAEIDVMDARITELRAEKERDDAALRMSAEVHPVHREGDGNNREAHYGDATRVTKEQRTYTAEKAVR